MLKNFRRSLTDLVGEDYINHVCAASSALTGESTAALRAVADTEVDCCPSWYIDRQEALMQRIGETIAPAYESRLAGAPTAAFRAAQVNAIAPQAGFGCFRVGEDGRLYFAGKSEHYHIPLGHYFPGFALIEHAKRIGVANATHNNARGYITRLTEASLIAAANGLAAPDAPEMEELLGKCEPGVLNRVINIETGSLAVEAALKMMLARFYPFDKNDAPYAGRIPVFLVMADNAGGITAGYHGTTIWAQSMRGLWPTLLEKAGEGGLYRVEGVPINDEEGFAEALARWNTPPYKVAGFCHEIILMNYGGILLTESFLKSAYKLCRESDTPVLCDEIQSCAWYEGLFLFRRYGIQPDFVSIGKGFPDGNYPASRLMFSAAFDNLSQFGALVTNGQEELASLTYLISMEFMRVNGAHVTEVGNYYHQGELALAKKYPKLIHSVEGDAHMSTLNFVTVDEAVDFCRRLQKESCIDISAQTYKPNCPPAVLTKLPIIATKEMLRILLDKYDKCLEKMEEEIHA